MKVWDLLYEWAVLTGKLADDYKSKSGVTDLSSQINLNRFKRLRDENKPKL
ncbi:hypothetical protein GCM10027185_09510 [Spirosoma pulveris]